MVEFEFHRLVKIILKTSVGSFEVHRMTQQWPAAADLAAGHLQVILRT